MWLLVLDGRLIGERTEEVNLAQLLKIAYKEFDSGSKTNLLTISDNL